MATYDLNTVASALVLDNMKGDGGKGAYRVDRYYNVLAKSGLAVGDTVFFDVDLPDWVRTLAAQKRSASSNADVLTITSRDDGFLAFSVQPLLFSMYANTPATSAATTNCNVIACRPVGGRVRISLTIAGSVPPTLLLGLTMYDQ